METAVKPVIFEQKFNPTGFSEFQTWPSPLEPIVRYRFPFGEKTPFVTELASPYSVATF